MGRPVCYFTLSAPRHSERVKKFKFPLSIPVLEQFSIVFESVSKFWAEARLGCRCLVVVRRTGVLFGLKAFDRFSWSVSAY